MSPRRALPAMIPGKLADHGLRDISPWPRCGMLISPERGYPYKKFWSGRRKTDYAVTFPFTDYGNAGGTWAALVFDCDDREAMAAGLAVLPTFNWLVRTDRGGHVAWCLAVPVHRHSVARLQPLTYLAVISEHFHYALGADAGFTGLGRNPLHVDQDEVWGTTRPYQLDELAQALPAERPRRQPAVTAIGRNVDVFRASCKRAGSDPTTPAVEIVRELNLEIGSKYESGPLPESEVRSIAKSIERYRDRWERNGWHSRKFLARQAARGSMPYNGAIQKSAKPEISNEADKPWEREGISRRTWYRRRALKRSASEGEN